jgi:hypothetical protein
MIRCGANTSTISRTCAVNGIFHDIVAGFENRTQQITAARGFVRDQDAFRLGRDFCACQLSTH